MVKNIFSLAGSLACCKIIVVSLFINLMSGCHSKLYVEIYNASTEGVTIQTRYLKKTLVPHARIEIEHSRIGEFVIISDIKRKIAFKSTQLILREKDIADSVANCLSAGKLICFIYTSDGLLSLGVREARDEKFYITKIEPQPPGFPIHGDIQSHPED